ncbi:MAG: relaxase/mobilization nuclease domain-containing protein [Cyanobacteria bacterium J06642_2]
MTKAGAQVVSRNVSGIGSQEVASAFNWERSRKPSIKHPCMHVILSVRPEESITQKQWRNIAIEYLQKMGFGHSRFVAVRHQDTDHDHIHIVCSRIDRSGKLVSDSWDRRRSERVIRDIERTYGLTSTLRPAQVIQRSARQQQRQNPKAIAEIKRRVDRSIHALDANNRSVMLLVERLAAEELQIQWRVRNRKLSGISFGIGGQAIAGSVLGKEYSWQGLQKYQGITATQSEERGIVLQQPLPPLKQRKEERSSVRQKCKLWFDRNDIEAVREGLEALALTAASESLPDVDEVSRSLEKEIEDMTRLEEGRAEEDGGFELVLDESVCEEDDGPVYIFDLSSGQFWSHAGTTTEPSEVEIFSTVNEARKSLPETGRYAAIATSARAIEAADLNPETIDRIYKASELALAGTSAHALPNFRVERLVENENYITTVWVGEVEIARFANARVEMICVSLEEIKIFENMTTQELDI